MTEQKNILIHDVMTKGYYTFYDQDGPFTVFGQRHSLYKIIQELDDNEWIEVDREFVDEFHLTDYEKGYKYENEDELLKFLNVDEFPDWDYNGFSNNWCGIEEKDSNEIRKKKWNDYKAKFPKATLIEHFRIEGKNYTESKLDNNNSTIVNESELIEMNGKKTGLPEWFDATVYEEGDTVINPFSGEKYKLNHLELSMYDFIQGCSMVSSDLINDKITKNWKNGLSWFRKNNIKAYNVLFEPNVISKYEESFKNEKQILKKFYSSGKLNTELYNSDGKGEGYHKTYYENGQLETYVPYHDGLMDGLFKNYFENGVLHLKRWMKNDKAEGITSCYYESGKIHHRSNYVNDLRDGIAVQFDEDGNLEADQRWKEGKQIDEQTGELVEDITVQNSNLKLKTNIKRDNIVDFINDLKKHINDEDVLILFHPGKWDVTEKTISDGQWEGKNYKIYADVDKKGVELKYDNTLKNLINEISEKNHIDEINAKEFDNLHWYSDNGGDVNIDKIEWETPLSIDEEKELEDYEGLHELFNDGSWEIDDLVYEDGEIFLIEVSVGNNIYSLETHAKTSQTNKDIFCSECGFKLKLKVKFCSNCGNKI